MAKYTNRGFYLDEEFFNDPDLQTPEDLAFAAMCRVRGDIIGVVPASVRTTAPICRLSHRKFRSVVDRFDKMGRLWKSSNWDKNGGHIWWKTGAYYGLMKGNPTEKQKGFAIDLILKWHSSGEFGDRSEEFDNRSEEFGNSSATFPRNFLEVATQLLVVQYQIKFSTPLLNKIKSNKIRSNQIISDNAVKTVTPKIPESTDPIKDFDDWSKTEGAKNRIDALTLNMGLSKERVNEEFNRARDWVIASPTKAARSLSDNHDGDWGSFFGRWLTRARDAHHRKGANV